ncbi:Uncharacterised protein [Bordetella pertussis]|nr:Uncharacterised protein [Bordetella pertussis]CFM07616.1 Uncharacterised protein [Bordetella pertussis]CFM53925.1 Uncharacterised protein [Bordetella pertussis]CFN12440.1 Uncharacterised protein [Bordetella pertussis]CFN19103.1 Uncharacterised protein [Bordetella pertussis]
MPTLAQSARAMLPMVQNTRFCSAWALAVNWISEISALKVKTSAMPNSTMAGAPIARCRATWSSSRPASAANRKA